MDRGVSWEETGLENLGLTAVDEGTWKIGNQCQVWEKIKRNSTFHSLANLVYAELKVLLKTLCWVFAGLGGRQ